jgi:hypothetical protein
MENNLGDKTMTNLKEIMNNAGCKIVGYDNNFKGDEVVVEFPVTGSAKKYYPTFQKSFPRKNFFKELISFIGR